MAVRPEHLSMALWSSTPTTCQRQTHHRGGVSFHSCSRVRASAPGGYSAEYGQALSSALVLDSKDRAESTRTDIGILSVGGDVAHTQAWKTGSAAAKVQYTNIKPYYGLINQEIDWKEPPVSTEAVAAFRQQIGTNGLFKLYGNFSRAHFSMYNHSIDDL